MRPHPFLLPVVMPLGKKREQELCAFQQHTGFIFQNLALLDLAFHHRSFTNEQSRFPFNNERLEFLGDSVLGLLTADVLYSKYPHKPEGDLAKVKAAVVSEDSLSDIARSLDINKYLVLGHGEELSGGRNKKALLADALEAVIGALYIDSGFAGVRRCLFDLLAAQVECVFQKDCKYRDYKSLFQEYVQKEFKTLPHYELISVCGPDHNRVFHVAVCVHNKEYAHASGKSKKAAEQAAAEAAWEVLNIKG